MQNATDNRFFFFDFTLQIKSDCASINLVVEFCIILSKNGGDGNG